jgi:hypothetical protein
MLIRNPGCAVNRGCDHPDLLVYMSNALKKRRDQKQLFLNRKAPGADPRAGYKFLLSVFSYSSSIEQNIQPAYSYCY